MTKIAHPSHLQRLLGLFSRRRRAQFVAVFLFTLVGAAAELVGIGAVLPFLQLVAAPASLAGSPAVARALSFIGGQSVLDLIVPAGVLLVATAALSSGARIVLTWITSRFTAGLTHDLSMMVFSRMIRQPYGTFIRRNSAEVLAGLDKVTYIGGYVLNPMLQALSSAVIGAGIIVLLLVVDPVAATIAAVTMGVSYAIIAAFSRPTLVRMGGRLARLSTAHFQVAQESLGGVRDIILDRSHAAFEKQFRDVDAEARGLAARITFISASPRYLIEGLAIVLIAMLAVYYTYRPGGVIGAIPILGALVLGAQRLLPLLQAINVAWVQYASTSGLLTDIIALLDAPALAALPRPADEKVSPFQNEIELRGVGFDYNSEVRALIDVDLVIPKGARVGFIGKTGSGKSTLLDLIMGLLEPTAGALLVDGVRLDDVAMQNWQAQIAHVPQAIFLADASIAANIAFGAADIDIERVRDAARRANIDTFIDTLADGYQTKVGERGVRLSGGQRQRIGIARALYKRATVLVLDEATSALDDETETAVMDGIERLDRTLTVLLIAHRLTTVRMCDNVVRLNEGRIVQVGSYAQIVAGEP